MLICLDNLTAALNSCLRYALDLVARVTQEVYPEEAGAWFDPCTSKSEVARLAWNDSFSTGAAHLYMFFELDNKLD